MKIILPTTTTSSSSAPFVFKALLSVSVILNTFTLGNSGPLCSIPAQLSDPCPGFGGIDEEDVNVGLTCYSVEGISQGNHEVDCTIIVPDDSREPMPLIVWANGWDQGNVNGENTSEGYLLGLKEWAMEGGYLIVAANQWSVQASDVLSCAKWAVECGNNEISGFEYDGNIGLVGHSQGAGEVVDAAEHLHDEGLVSANAAVMAMNPYGPDWTSNNAGNLNGPVLIVGGSDDTSTPPESYDTLWYDIFDQGPYGGINAILLGGTHNSEAWNGNGEGGTVSWEDAAKTNFGAYQTIGLLWWNSHLKNVPPAGQKLKRELDDTDLWLTDYTLEFD